ncbi:hypothetical protein SARC_01680 [Sphaeroforma arctica JP610]|uniref:Uncharacterized protein n=1 Tax=Sphaeroforma arctica JP610 TaxID=667725 RepID=A0A0L0GB80_9EUKA|nr:hypothetical protein SARC_01680 [Sphaeroforma arctica JP610]KNC86154.1 hypothetical protein SARC_01680 [Sphaeroforma arctica JP610]|eukprot:XP_014160056.1 hypothetical protein SARC_01680 [Sphaeroforma arctica JP610]
MLSNRCETIWARRYMYTAETCNSVYSSVASVLKATFGPGQKQCIGFSTLKIVSTHKHTCEFLVLVETAKTLRTITHPEGIEAKRKAEEGRVRKEVERRREQEDTQPQRQLAQQSHDAYIFLHGKNT